MLQNKISSVFILISILVVVDGTESVESSTGMEAIKGGTKTIVVIGASYAGGWDPGRPIAGYRLFNKGISGQQSFEMLARFETDVVALKPDAVIIWGFINDIFRSDPVHMDQTLARTRENILTMIALAKTSGVVPIVATEVTVRGQDSWSEVLSGLFGRIRGKINYQDYINRQVIEINRWLRETATHEGVLLLDLEPVFADRQGVRRKEFSQPDGSHISQSGYEALTSYVEERLKSRVVTH